MLFSPRVLSVLMIFFFFPSWGGRGLHKVVLVILFVVFLCVTK